MTSTTTRQRDELLKLAAKFRRSAQFDVNRKEYVDTVPSQCDTTPSNDPIVPYDCCQISPAWLTIDTYNSLVLNSPNVLIAEIGYGDPRIDEGAAFTEDSDAIASFHSLDMFDRIYDSHVRDESWRIYETQFGWRAICTSRTFEPHWLAQDVLRFVRSDPSYMKRCMDQKCFRARLTPMQLHIPKAQPVCRLIEEIGDQVLPELAEQIRLHDELTLIATSGRTLA